MKIKEFYEQIGFKNNNNCYYLEKEGYNFYLKEYESFIKINSYYVSKLGEQLINYGSDLESDIQKLIAAIESLEKVWTGEDSKNYCNIMLGINIKEIEKIKDLIKNYGEYLKNVSNVYKELDIVFSSKSIE